MEAQEGPLSGAAQVSSACLRQSQRVYVLVRGVRPGHVCRYQHQVLMRNSVVTEANKNLLVETFRCIAEILIWGDQNDSRVFE